MTISALIWCLLALSSVESGENHFVQLKKSRRHLSVLSMNDTAGKSIVIGIDALHLMRLLEMDPNIYVLYIGDRIEFERSFGGSKKAMHITLKQIKENTLQIPKGRTLILICSSGQKSPVAAKILSTHGYVVYYLIGGMKALNETENRKPMLMKEKHEIENENKTIREKNNEQHQPSSIFEEEDMGC